jgi:hypothetical protein
VLVAAVLLLLVLAAGTLDRTGVPGAVVLLGLSVLWLLVNGPMEGATLADLGGGHGVTAADLASVAGGGLAVERLLRRLGPGRRRG